MAQDFAVHDYTYDALLEILAANSEASVEVVKRKSQSYYFQSYFQHIGAKIIVVESNYTDRDFLEDYSSYYVRCFHDYKAVCTRLHFFSRKFGRQALLALLSGRRTVAFRKQLQDSYLGFIVVKPLPQTIIGRTCLTTYSSDGGRRCYPILRSYKASLFGVPLEVRNTLAFQEQDSVAAACATSALWSTFHGTGIRFQHAIPSPVEITRAALVSFATDERNLPNHGLSDPQMAHAIRSVGLEPFPITVTDPFQLRAAAYAYLRDGVPVPLLLTLHHKSQKKCDGHAVALTGYSLPTGPPVVYPHTQDFRLKALRVDKLYAHDDGIGPFARMEISDVEIEVDPFDGKLLLDNAGNPCPQKTNALTTTWMDNQRIIGNIYAIPNFLLVPLYHKIRIPFVTAMVVVQFFDQFTKLQKVAASLKLQAPLEWDVYLTEVNRLKQEILESDCLPGPYLKEVLLQPMPKYIWRATAEQSGSRVLDLLLDATDIDQGPLMVRAIEYDPNIGFALRTCTRVDHIVEPLKYHPVWRILKWFADQPVS